MKEIQLTQGKVALVDDEDYESVNCFLWYARRNKRKFYALSRTKSLDGKYIPISMHRFILDAPTGKQVDHIDGNGLNNTKVNLRLVNNSENHQNRDAVLGLSKYKGVGWHRRVNKWYAHIKLNGRHMHLGYFDVEEEAARIYDRVALQIFTHARPNFDDYGNTKFNDQELIERLFLPRQKTSEITGVNWHKKQKKWAARVTIGGSRIYLGSFLTEKEASESIQLYLNASRKITNGSYVSIDKSPDR